MTPRCGKCGSEKKRCPSGQWQCWPCSAKRAKLRYHKIVSDPAKSGAYKKKWQAAITRWGKNNKAKLARYQKAFKDKVRMEVLTAYGGPSPACKCCGERELGLLTIDHIVPCGRTGRKQVGSGLYCWLRKRAFPEGYRVLCMNCNFAMGIFGYCPHKGRPLPIVHACPIKRSQQKTRLKRKMMALCAYGGPTPSCGCCRETHIEFLTVDHKDQNGATHRKSLPSGGGAIYTWLRRNGYPKGFRVLCISCNHAIGVRGSCPHRRVRPQLLTLTKGTQ